MEPLRLFLAATGEADEEDSRAMRCGLLRVASGCALTGADIAHLNPNTNTAPVFRSRTDASLTARIYSKVPILIREDAGSDGNAWGVSFMAMFHMANDSGLFRNANDLIAQGYQRNGTCWANPIDAGTDRYVALQEAKLVHQYDHRWGTYATDGIRDVEEIEKQDPLFEPSPRYWVPQSEVVERLAQKGWNRRWMIAWRRNARSTDDRTLIADVIPWSGVGDSLFLLIPATDPEKCGALIGCLNSLVQDFVVRQKVGGANLSYHFVSQFPVLPPSTFAEEALSFLTPRILELTYTSHSMEPFALDLGCKGPPFPWSESRRARIRTELDAWYARAYGLTRDELRYVLDPADAMGEDYPSETFRVLKNSEMKKFGEYRTRRLVLEAWDRMEAGDLK
jgi:hypothetical protein